MQLNRKRVRDQPHDCQSIIVLIFFMFVSSIVAVSFGKEFTWDFLSYHYYTPYAVFHHRFGFDYFPPVSVQQYYNPTMDFLTYFLVNHLPPIGVKLTMGAVHGVNEWLIFLISLVVLRQYALSSVSSIAFLLSLLSFTGALALTETGVFVGDATLSIFILASLYFFLLTFAENERRRRFLLMSGACFGLSLGLKLTSIIYLPGFILGFLFLPYACFDRCKQLLLWFITVFVVFFVVDLFWMHFLWVRFHNPFYPLFNGFFHAAGFPWINLVNNIYFPQGAIHRLLSPFYFSWSGNVTWPIRDLREFIFFVLCFIAAPIWITVYAKDKKLTTILLVFFIGSYFFWEYTFSIVRYQLSLEMLSPLLIYILCRFIANHLSQFFFIVIFLLLFSLFLILIFFGNSFSLFYLLPIDCVVSVIALWIVIYFPENKAGSLFFLIFFNVYGTIHYPISEHVAWYGRKYFEVAMPPMVKTTPKAMVIGLVPNYLQCDDIRLALPTTKKIVAPPPAYFTPTSSVMPGYLIPFFPKDWQLTGVYISFERCALKKKQVLSLCESYTVTTPILKRIADYPGPIFLLTTQSNLVSFSAFADSIGLKNSGHCQVIQTVVSAIDHEVVLLCPVQKSTNKISF